MRNLCVFLVIILSVLIDFSISSAQDEIVFEKTYAGKTDIYVAEISSRNNIRNIRNLTEHSAGGRCPAWSPDKRKIVFISGQLGNSAIYIMDSDGRNVRILTKEIKGNVWWPEWSPDGRKIAFRYDTDLYIVDVDGNNLRKLSEVGVILRWSPDGKKIVLESLETYIIDVDIDVKKWEDLVGREIDSYGAIIDWSAEGIAYLNKDEFIVSTPAGEVLKRYPLLDLFSWNIGSLSPDGGRLIFPGSKRIGEWSLYVLDLKNGKYTDTGIEGSRPDWGRGFMALGPRNLLPTTWSLIKKRDN